jgi:hypothetical protein
MYHTRRLCRANAKSHSGPVKTPNGIIAAAYVYSVLISYRDTDRKRSPQASSAEKVYPDTSLDQRTLVSSRAAAALVNCRAAVFFRLGVALICSCREQRPPKSRAGQTIDRAGTFADVLSVDS